MSVPRTSLSSIRRINNQTVRLIVDEASGTSRHPSFIHRYQMIPSLYHHRYHQYHPHPPPPPPDDDHGTDYHPQNHGHPPWEGTATMTQLPSASSSSSSIRRSPVSQRRSTSPCCWPLLMTGETAITAITTTANDYFCLWQIATTTSTSTIAGSSSRSSSPCHQSFTTAEKLFEHVTEHHIGRKSRGNLCLTCHWEGCSQIRIPQATASATATANTPPIQKRDHIISHLRVHIPYRPHICEVRVDRSSEASSLMSPSCLAVSHYAHRDHYHHHHRHPSQMCGKKFSRGPDLRKHLKVHAKQLKQRDAVRLEMAQIAAVQQQQQQQQQQQSLHIHAEFTGADRMYQDVHRPRQQQVSTRGSRSRDSRAVPSRSYDGNGGGGGGGGGGMMVRALGSLPPCARGSTCSLTTDDSYPTAAAAASAAASTTTTATTATAMGLPYSGAHSTISTASTPSMSAYLWPSSYPPFSSANGEVHGYYAFPGACSNVTMVPDPHHAQRYPQPQSQSQSQPSHQPASAPAPAPAPPQQQLLQQRHAPRHVAEHVDTPFPSSTRRTVVTSFEAVSATPLDRARTSTATAAAAAGRPAHGRASQNWLASHRVVLSGPVVAGTVYQQKQQQQQQHAQTMDGKAVREIGADQGLPVMSAHQPWHATYHPVPYAMYPSQGTCNVPPVSAPSSL